jgi:hypothetical protein
MDLPDAYSQVWIPAYSCAVGSQNSSGSVSFLCFFFYNKVVMHRATEYKRRPLLERKQFKFCLYSTDDGACRLAVRLAASVHDLELCVTRVQPFASSDVHMFTSSGKCRML